MAQKINLSVHDVIPFSNLAKYGKFEYASENDRTFSLETWSYNFSAIQDSDDEPFLLDAVQEECFRLVSPKLLKETKPFPSYLLDLCQKTAENNDDSYFLFNLLPTSIIDEMEVAHDFNSDDKDELPKSCGLHCNSNSYLCQNFTSVLGDGSSSSIWKPCGLFEQCEKCVEEPLENCRVSNLFVCCKDRQNYLNVTEILGAFFPSEWQLPQVVDPIELQETLLVSTWKTGIKQHRECNQAKRTSRKTVNDDDELFISLAEFTKFRGLPIPVHFKSLESYNSMIRECGIGANLRNLILLSPQSCRNHRERAWWHCYGEVNKSTPQEELKPQKQEHKTRKTSRRLYSDVVLKASPCKQTSDATVESLEQSPHSSLISSEIFFNDLFNRSFEEFPVLSPSHKS